MFKKILILSRISVKMTVLIVGLWRAPWAAASSINTMHLNSSRILVSTSQLTQCTKKSPCCHIPNVTKDVLRYFPRAKVSLDEVSDQFMRRLHTALMTFKNEIHLSKWLLVLRPDVQLNHRIPTHLEGLGIIPGGIYRPYFFSNRDWDFGYIARPPSVLSYWVCCYHNRTLPHVKPALPKGIEGKWTHRDAVYENSIIQLRDRYKPMYGVQGAILTLRRCKN